MLQAEHVHLGVVGDFLRAVAVVRDDVLRIVDANLRNVRWLASRDIMNVKTRVRSVCHASSSRSNISAEWSANAVGDAERLVHQRHVSCLLLCLRCAGSGARSRERRRGSRRRARGRGRPAATAAPGPRRRWRPGCCGPRCSCSAALLARPAVAEQALERDPRVDLHRQRRGRGRPRDRVHVGAAEPRRAAADVAGEVLGRELERRERRRPVRTAAPAPGRWWCRCGSPRPRSRFGMAPLNQPQAAAACICCCPPARRRLLMTVSDSLTAPASSASATARARRQLAGVHDAMSAPCGT